MIPVAVFDCMIFLQAAARPTGPSFACLNRVFERRVILTVSHPIITEVRDVLGRAHIQHKFPEIAATGVEAFLNRLLLFTRLIDPVPLVLTIARDPKDEPYINLALAVSADYLVTWDRDLLDLPRSRLPESQHLVQRHPRLQIIEPTTFLRELDAAEGRRA